MQKRVFLFLCCLMCLFRLSAQTPMYFKTGTGTVGNTIPLNQASQKTQLLYAPGEFATAPPSGLITKIYFRNSTAGASGTYTNFEVGFKQNNDPSFPSTSYYTGFTNALTAATITIPGNALAGGWFEIPLPPPYFTFDNSQTLILEIRYTAVTGGLSTTTSTSTSGNKRCSGTSLTATTGTTNTTWNDFGMDIAPAGPCTAPPTPGTAITSASSICNGNSVTLNTTGTSIGTGMTYQWQSSTTATGTYTNINTAGATSVYTITPTATMFYRAAVTCGASTTYSTPVQVVVNQGLAGTFTINSANPTAGTNFQSFNDAVTALACGVTGPVVFNVASGSGPYNEQVVIPALPGTSATNTVTFNGNGNTITATPPSANRAIITLDDADYVILDSLRLVSQSATYGRGVHLTNGADHNIIRKCIIDMTLVTSATEANSGGIIGSGSATSVTTAGDANFNLISGNTILGAYVGIMLRGGTGSTACVKNRIINNNIKDFYANGIELFYADSAVVDGNDISRAARAAVTTFAGISLGTDNIKCRINANKIHDTHNTATTQSGTAYGIYLTSADATTGNENILSNNLIYNFNSTTGTQYGIYNSSSDGNWILHNTVVLDHAASTSGITRGFYQLTSATNIQIRNNIFSISRGGSGVKYCLYFGTAASTIASNNNDLFINSTGGTNGIGYYSTGYTTLSAWRTANSGIYDLQSDSLDPVFTNPATDNYIPTAAALDNRGTPQGITTDITRATRNATTPDLGAYEFGLPPCVPPPATITPAGPLTVCNGTNIVLNANTGTGINYQWKQGANNITGATNATYSPTASGQYSVITAIGTCNTTSDTVTITFIPRPDTAVTVAPANATACTGGSVLLNVATVTGTTYQWLRNGVAIASATGAAYTATTAGDYRVRVSNGTCADTSVARTVTFLAAPTAVIVPPTSTAICPGSSLVLRGNTPSAGLTYQWLFNGAPIPAANNDTYTATNAGAYRLIVSNGTCADTAAAVNITFSPRPTATATPAGPLTLCSGSTATLTANAGTGISYTWLRNTQPIVPAATNRTYTAAQTGVYQVVVRDNASGCTDTSAPGIIVSVSTPPANTLNATGSLTFCDGSNVTLQAATSTGYTYQWHRSTGMIPGAQSATYTATTSGTYHVVVTSGACTTTSVTRTVVVNPLPAATATPAGSTSICQGSVVINANTGTGLTYQWRNATGIIPGATGASYTATASGNYSVVVSNGSCTNTSAIVPVNISSLPAPVITANGPAAFCQNGDVTLQTVANPAYTYQWRLNNADLPGANNNVLVANIPGDYVVVVTNGSCVASSPVLNVTVYAIPPADALPDGPTTFCQGEAVVLLGNIGAGYTYQWQLNGADIPGANGQSHIVTASGDYAVHISDGRCEQLSTEVTITVHPTPSTPVIVVTNQVQLSTTGNYISYQWYRNGVLIPGATAGTHTATQDGTYTVMAGNAFGCQATSEGQIISSLGVGGPVAQGISVWPNPAQDVIHVSAAQPVNISVCALDGKELMHAAKATRLDIKPLPQGVYMIRIADAKTNTLINIQRFIKN